MENIAAAFLDLGKMILLLQISSERSNLVGAMCAVCPNWS